MKFLPQNLKLKSRKSNLNLKLVFLVYTAFTLFTLYQKETITFLPKSILFRFLRLEIIHKYTG